jgi:hypothetical protein
MLEIGDWHTFTANDHFGNFGNSVEHPVDNFSFRIDGDTLAITEVHEDDPRAGTMLEVAPWIRVS